MSDLNGQWWNPNFGGEGFYLTEQDGRLIGAYFTYDDISEPIWYVFDCQRVGDTYSGRVIRTDGGSMASPLNAQNVQQADAGSITFTLNGTWVFDARIKGSSIGYPLFKLFPVDGTEPQPPEPPPEPPEPPQPVENPFEGKLTFRHKPYKQPNWFNGSFMQNPDGDWFAVWSTPQIQWDQLRTGRNTMYEMEITAIEEVRFTGHGASGYGNPSIEGLPEIIPAGETIEISFELDKASRPNGHANANYQIDTQWGTLVLLTERILGGQ